MSRRKADKFTTKNYKYHIVSNIMQYTKNNIKKYSALIFCILILIACESKREKNIPNVALPGVLRDKDVTPPHVILLSSLPDSLQPKTVFLEQMPKPLYVPIPKNTGGVYSTKNSPEGLAKIKLEPPVQKMLPVLLDEKGKPVKGKDGKPFFMDRGGIPNFTNFTTENGLALDAIISSFVDKTGNIWFGSIGGGVSRYNGKTFNTFSTVQGLCNNIVWSIAEDINGNIWFGTQGGGVSRYDGNTFTTFTTADGLGGNNVLGITSDKAGNLWFATEGGLSRYLPKASKGRGSAVFTTISTHQAFSIKNLKCIAEDKKGNLWIGGHSCAMCYNGKSCIPFTTKDGLASNNVNSIIVDKMGYIWFGTDNGLSRCKPSATPGLDSFTSFSTGDGLASDKVNCIIQDKSGKIWCGTGRGVSCLDFSILQKKSKESFTTFTMAEGLPNNNILSLAEDKSGNIWCCTRGGGVCKYEKSLSSFSTKQGLESDNIRSIVEDRKGNLWIGTAGSGVSRFDGNSFTTFSVKQGLGYSEVRCMAADKNDNLWFGTWGGGVSCFDGKSFTTFSTAQGLPNNFIRSITQDKLGNLWFGTWGNGICSYNGKSFTSFSEAQGLGNNTVYCATEDKWGNLWFGTKGGVSRYDGKSFVNFSRAQGLASNNVKSIFTDNTGNIWLATDEGLSLLTIAEQQRLLNINDTKAVFKTFTKKDGLPDVFLTQVLQMQNGKIAVGTNLGITIFRPSADYNTLTEIEMYNTLTGYPIRDINTGQSCMLLDSKGILWAGTGNAKTPVIRFDPNVPHNSRTPPALFIEGIKVDEENICWHDLEQKNKAESVGKGRSAAINEEVTNLGKILTEPERDSMRHRFGDIAFTGISRFYPVPQQLILSYRHNKISIDFVAVETNMPNLIDYQYILVGYDKEWSHIQKKSSATFGNIGEGTYTFKMKARSTNGVWSAPLTYKFRVLPPWYRTWWAYTIYAVSFLISIGFLSNWRQRSLRRDKLMLEKTVQDRTEELLHKNQIVEQQKKEVELGKQRSDELVLQKDMLLREIHHRVKNNLQVISALLELQSNSLVDENAKKAITESISRVRSISLIHQQLYQDEQVATIEISKFISDLFIQVSSLYQLGETVELINNVSEQQFDIDTAVSLGLILNELFTNSFKYAFTNGKQGAIKVDLEEVAAHNYKLYYSDNGPGIPLTFNVEKSKSLGMRMMNRLSKQIGGKLLYDRPGARFVISFLDETGRKAID